MALESESKKMCQKNVSECVVQRQILYYPGADLGVVRVVRSNPLN